VNEPLTITVHTLDHGPVTLPEPAWCIGRHEDGGHRADILHQGPDVLLAFHGQHITAANIVQSPFAEHTTPGLGGRTPGVSVSAIGRTLDPVAVYELAARLDAYADQLRGLADQLAALLDGGEAR
jgi:hypothetical protein